jgi:hypothetical protein
LDEEIKCTVGIFVINSRMGVDGMVCGDGIAAERIHFLNDVHVHV